MDQNIEFFEDLLITQLENYINCRKIEHDNLENYWNRMRLDPNMSRFAEISIRIINIPCTEAAVEKFNTSDEFLDAEIGIRMENIYSSQEN